MTSIRIFVLLIVLASCAGEAAMRPAASDRSSDATASTAGAARAATVRGDLAQTLRREAAAAGGPVWLAWEVPMDPDLGSPCCFDNGFRPSTCRLEGRNQGWGTNRDDGRGSGRLLVLVRWDDGDVDHVRHYDALCPIDASPLSIRRLEGVSPEESVAWLADLAQRAEGRRDRDEPMAALAYHSGAAAMSALRDFASEPHDHDLREKALFWIGQTRGEEGARFLARVVHDDPDTDIRKKAIFSLSQNDAPIAEETIVEVARHDRDPEVRADALFWLAQTGGEGTADVLFEALDVDPSDEVREKAVFAMSQLKGGGVPLLIRVARERRRDPEVRRQAIFWLGQSKDPRALEFLASILED